VSVPVRVTPAARDDIRQGRDYFDSRESGLGEEFVDEVLATLDRIREMPFMYGEIENGVRAGGLRRFGYVVFYRTDGTEAEALAILHGGRSPETWRGRM